MRRVLAWIQGFAESLGGPGLFIIAFLDSSFLSFPEVSDALIVLLTVQYPERMIFYALDDRHVLALFRQGLRHAQEEGRQAGR